MAEEQAMNEPPEFEPIISALKSHGRYWSLQTLADGSKRLVCVSNRSDDGCLHGNSFWVAHRNGQWWLVCWTTAAYRVPNEVDLGELCIEALELGRTPIFSLPADLIERFGLIRDDKGFD